MFALFMGIKNISPTDLQRAIEKKTVTVIDVNFPQSWMKAHVPGALNLDPVQFAESQLPADKLSQLVFYCSNPMCRKAPSAARRAKKMGFGNAMVMSAGISGWQSAKLLTESAA